MKTFTVTEAGRKGISFKYKKGGPNEMFGIPVGQSITKDCEATGLDEVETLLHRIDLAQDNDKLRVVKEQNPNDRIALVLVQTAPGVGGALKLFANTVKETFDEKKRRVVRDAMPIEEAAGIEIIAEKPAEGESSAEYLMAMQPGASFRITRTGKLFQAAPEIVVLWNGRWDYRVENPRFRAGDVGSFDRQKDQADCLRYLKNPVDFWGLSVFARRTRHGQV